MGISRRAWLGSLAALMVGCGRKEEARNPAEEEPVPAPEPPAIASSPFTTTATEGSSLEVRELDDGAAGLGKTKAVVLVPRWLRTGERLPMLVALHGRAEALRGLEAGAYAWLRDYRLDRAIERLRNPPLTPDDFNGFVTQARLDAINQSLEARPFRGFVLVCPYVPDLLDSSRRDRLDAAGPFGAYLVDRLLPRIRTEGPVLTDTQATGIDGVSLGGRVALVVGSSHAAEFGAVGSLQAAIQRSETAPLVERIARARRTNPRLSLRLVTSEGDFFRKGIASLHDALAGRGIEHGHLLVPGPHDYAFNRGPGAVEMLLWHDRVLRGEPGL